MTKRILCRVVRSVPFTKDSDAWLEINQSDNKCHKFGDTVTVDVRVRHRSNPVTYTGQGDISRVSVDAALLGQILNCLA